MISIIFRVSKENRYSIIPLIAVLEKYSVRICILKDGLDSNLIEKAIDSNKKALIAYSFMSHQAVSIYNEWADLKKRFEDKVVIIAGGSHPTAKPKEALKFGADVVCCFDGESIILDILNSFIKGDDLKKEIFFKRHATWGYDFPFPKNPKFISPIEITRGCPFKCKYCQTPMLKGNKVKHKKLEVIVEAVKFLAKHNAKDVRFISPNALSYGSEDGKKFNRDKVENLLYMIKSNLPKDGKIFFGSFPSEVRPEFLNEESIKIIKKYCSNKRIVFGAQSGSPDMLKRMQRGHNVEDVINATDLLIKHNIEPIVDFIIGLPEETEEEILSSIALMEKLANMGAKIHLHFFMPLPGTSWANKMPSKVPKRAIKKINLLLSRGKLFGQWRSQEKFATQTKIYENL